MLHGKRAWHARSGRSCEISMKHANVHVALSEAKIENLAKLSCVETCHRGNVAQSTTAAYLLLDERPFDGPAEPSLLRCKFCTFFFWLFVKRAMVSARKRSVYPEEQPGPGIPPNNPGQISHPQNRFCAVNFSQNQFRLARPKMPDLTGRRQIDGAQNAILS